MGDGTGLVATAGDYLEIGPGHRASVEGDEPCIQRLLHEQPVPMAAISLASSPARSLSPGGLFATPGRRMQA